MYNNSSIYIVCNTKNCIPIKDKVNNIHFTCKIVSLFSQDRVKFSQQWREALAWLFVYHVDVTSWRHSAGRISDHVGLCTRSSHCCIGTYLALFIVITVILIVIVVVCCVAIALLY